MSARHWVRGVVPVAILGGVVFAVLAGAQAQRIEKTLVVEPANLEMGKTYLIRVTKPMVLPAGMELVPIGSTNQGFYHNGQRQDRPGTQCGGDITQLLDDKGAVGYRCERCKRQWDPRGK